MAVAYQFTYLDLLAYYVLQVKATFYALASGYSWHTPDLWKLGNTPGQSPMQASGSGGSPAAAPCPC